MRFCYAMLVLHECMFLHANITFFQGRNTERERFYLQALRLRRNFYFGPPCQEDAITRKEKKKKKSGNARLLICKSKISASKSLKRCRLSGTE